YYTPNGRSIQAQGIEPDVNVERVQVTAFQQGLATTEADLARHLGNSKGGTESTSKDRASKRISSAELLKEDNQLHEALNLLKGLNIFIQNTPLAAATAEPAPIAPDIVVQPELPSEGEREESE
ncbi:MAG TPA: peptidase S41, partial [Cellvibrio sp.]|nr:peptidase S41 [Cellvibrio sp.]